MEVPAQIVRCGVNTLVVKWYDLASVNSEESYDLFIKSKLYRL